MHGVSSDASGRVLRDEDDDDEDNDADDADDDAEDDLEDKEEEEEEEEEDGDVRNRGERQRGGQQEKDNVFVLMGPHMQ